LWDHFFTQVEPVASKCNTMCALVIMSMIGLYSPGNRIGPMQFTELMAVVNVGLLVPYSLKFNMPENSSESTGTRAPGLETFVHIN